jgi:hypothetical protein
MITATLVLSVSAAAQQAALPPIPELTAHYSGSSIVSRYHFKTWPKASDRRPWILQTSVLSADSRIPRLTKETLVKRPQGTVVQPRGIGPRPFHVLYTVISYGHTRTAPRTVLVHAR